VPARSGGADVCVFGVIGSRWTWVNGPAFQICVVSIAIVTACAFPQPDVVCGGQVCKEQQICAARQAVCIDPGSCGDGVIDPGEVCDDGNVTDGDGCSADCHSDETCGNGIIDLHATPTTQRSVTMAG